MVSLPDDRSDFSRKSCNALLDEIGSRIPPQQFETWFRNLPIHCIAPDRIVVTAPNRFSKTWIERKFRDVIISSARLIFGIDPRLEILVHQEDSEESRIPRRDPLSPAPGFLRSGRLPSRSRIADVPRSPEAEQSPVLAESLEVLPSSPVNRDFTFTNFVIGPSNRLSHAAALGVTESPGRSYNPLFIYGGVGLGKTHLLHAIVHRLNESPGLRVTYLTSESFKEQAAAALARNEIDEFRRRLRSTDVLIIDDVQFISRKDNTQEEFFNTFNALISETKQVVLSSDCPPKEIPGLKDRLVSRFKMGLVARIDPPSFETRVSIILKKARTRGREISESVAEYMANHIVGNIRELEGAINRLFSLASIHRSPDDHAGPPITVDLARSALNEIAHDEGMQSAVAITEIQKATAQFYDVKISELLSQRRNRTISFARQVCMYLARQLTRCSLQEIGSVLGGRDHATVLYSIKKVESMSRKDPRLKADLKVLMNRIAAPRSTL